MNSILNHLIISLVGKSLTSKEKSKLGTYKTLKGATNFLSKKGINDIDKDLITKASKLSREGDKLKTKDKQELVNYALNKLENELNSLTNEWGSTKMSISSIIDSVKTSIKIRKKDYASNIAYIFRLIDKIKAKDVPTMRLFLLFY